MRGYRKPIGAYIELRDGEAVGASLVEVALRPSPAHVFADAWQTDPLTAAVCWREKTGAEITAEKDADLQSFLDSAGGKVVRAIFQVGVDKTLWTLADVRTKYRALP